MKINDTIATLRELTQEFEFSTKKAQETAT